MTKINTIQDIYDQRAEEERAKLRLLEAKRKQKGRPAMTEREKTKNALQGLTPKRGRKINTLPFADIHVVKDHNDLALPGVERVDSNNSVQQWG